MTTTRPLLASNLRELTLWPSGPRQHQQSDENATVHATVLKHAREANKIAQWSHGCCCRKKFGEALVCGNPPAATCDSSQVCDVAVCPEHFDVSAIPNASLQQISP